MSRGCSSTWGMAVPSRESPGDFHILITRCAACWRERTKTGLAVITRHQLLYSGTSLIVCGGISLGGLPCWVGPRPSPEFPISYLNQQARIVACPSAPQSTRTL